MGAQLKCIENLCIEDFLGVKVPTDKAPVNFSDLVFFNESNINALVPEGEKQRFINQAVFDKENERIFSVFNVKFEYCEDHFPSYPMLPMAKLGQIMAQVGSLLIMSSEDFNLADNNGKNSFPLVKSVQSIESFATIIHGKRKVFITPNDNLLIVAEYPRGKITTRSTNILVYVEATQIATMALTYEVLSWSLFIKLYEHQR